MAMQMQSLLASPMGSFANGSTRSNVTSFGLAPKTKRQTVFRVKCSAEEEGEEYDLETHLPKLNPCSSEGPKVEPPSTSSSSSTPKPLPKVSTKLSDLLAFSGPAPKRINGRLAMIRFVTAVAVELSNGTDLIDQITNGGGEWFIGTSIVLSAASMVPLLKGKRAESKTDGLMNSNAEMLNGRFAMLGLVALAFTEFVKRGALI
ncbi:hypothetical protein RND81_13G065000 [Saponaria officinalis]|uniref:Uncharacterized protein n=1 Tax=Saponaria officinalis TaxID=3572 RepID=A0AAW1H125_SAPOF